MKTSDDRSDHAPRVKLARRGRGAIAPGATLGFAALVVFFVWGWPGALVVGGVAALWWLLRSTRTEG